MSPIRHISHGGVPDRTLAGDLPPGHWRYSSRLALVLSGGGARGAYQVGVLTGLAERLKGLEFPIVSGVSAGAINAAFVAAHPGSLETMVTDLQAQWRRLTSDAVYRVHPVKLAGSASRWLFRGVTARRRGPAVIKGLVDTDPLREFLKGCLDMDGIAAKLAMGSLRAAALSAVSYSTGQTMTFVQGGRQFAPWQRVQRVAIHAQLTIEHVLASAAIPLLFPAVKLGEDYFGDGSVGATAPLAPSIHLGARGIVAIGAGTPAHWRPPITEYPTTAEVMGLLFRSIFIDALDTDAERLERINHLLAAFPPGVQRPAGLAPVELLLIRPSRNLRELAAGRDGLLPPAMRRIVQAIGGGREAAAEFLAYLLFHPEYTSPLMEFGYDDVATQWPAIERFFEAMERKPAPEL